MPHIELPRTLASYFAFAELTPTRNGRRFTITLPYRNGTRIDRIQWWYHIPAAQERTIEASGLAAFRAQAAERFCRHIERWLANTGQRLHGDDPIPSIGPLNDSVAVLTPPSVPAEAPAEVVAFTAGKAACG